MYIKDSKEEQSDKYHTEWENSSNKVEININHMLLQLNRSDSWIHYINIFLLIMCNQFHKKYILLNLNKSNTLPKSYYKAGTTLILGSK